jgi:hypothetical protein
VGPKANGYRNPLGTESGCGLVLMRRKDLDAIDLEERHDLVLYDDDGETITLHNLHVAGDTTCLTPGAPDDEDAVHLVPLADDRRLMALALPHLAFGLRTTPTGNFSENTSDGGTQFTWAEVWQQIWAAAPNTYAGDDAPSLPVQPETGDPEGFDGFEATWPELAAHFLGRLGCDLALDLTAEDDGRWSVVELGGGADGPNDGADGAADDLEGRRLHDREPVTVTRGTIPKTVTVFFRKQPTRGYGNDQYWYVEVGADQSQTGGGGKIARDVEDSQEGTVRIYDDMVATYQGNTLTNTDALQARAEERAEQFFRERAEWYAQPMLKVYSGFTDQIAPGETVRAVTWMDRGGAAYPGPSAGMTTEVERDVPDDPLESWPDNPEQPWRLTEVVYVTQTALGDYWDAFVERKNAASGVTERLFECAFWAFNHENPPTEGRYVGVFQGFDGGSGLPLYAGGCCPTGGDGGGVQPPGGPIDTPPPVGGTVSVPCCPVVLSTNLVWNITGTTGTCGCLPASGALTYNASTGLWTSLNTGCGGNFDFEFGCSPGGPGGGGTVLDFFIQQLESSNCTFSAAPVYAGNDSTCDPLRLTFSGTAIADCCAGTFDMVITGTL